MAGRGYVKVDLAFVGHDQISATIKKTQANLEKTGSAAEKIGTKSKDAFEKMKQGSEGLSKNLTKAAASVYLLEKAFGYAQQALEFVKEGEQLKNLGLMFSQVVDETGMALDLFKKKTAGIVDESTLQKTGIEFTNMGFSIRESAAVMEVATLKSMAEMREFSEVASDLGKTIVGGRKDSLEALGITIDFRKEYEKYAHSIGVNVKNLTKTDELHVRMKTTLKAITGDTNLAGLELGDFYTLGQKLGVDAHDMLGNIQQDTATFVENILEGSGNAELHAEVMTNAIDNIVSGTGDLGAAGKMLDQTLGLTDESADAIKKLGQERRDAEPDLDLGDTLYEWPVGLVTTTKVEQEALEASGKAHIELLNIIIDAKEAKKKAHREEILAAQEHQKESSQLVSRNRIFQYEQVEKLGKETNEAREKNLLEAKATLYAFYETTKALDHSNADVKKQAQADGYVEEKRQFYLQANDIEKLEREKNGRVISLTGYHNEEMEKMVQRGTWGTMKITEYGYKKIRILAEKNYRALNNYRRTDTEEAQEAIDEIQLGLVDQMHTIAGYSEEWEKLGTILEKGGIRETTPEIARLEQELKQTTVGSKKQELEETIIRAKATLEYENLALIAMTSSLAESEIKLARNDAIAKGQTQNVDALNKTLQQIESDIAQYQAFDLEKMIAVMLKGTKNRGKGQSRLNKELKKSADLLKKELELISLKKYATDKHNLAEQKALVIRQHVAKQAELDRKRDLDLGKKLKGKTEEEVTGKRLEKLMRINGQYDRDRRKLANETEQAIYQITDMQIDRRASLAELDTDRSILLFDKENQALLDSLDYETHIRAQHSAKMFSLESKHDDEIDKLTAQRLKSDSDTALIDKEIELEKLNFKKATGEEEKALIQELTDLRVSELENWSSAMGDALSGIEEYGEGWGTALSGVQDITAAITDNIGDQKKQAAGAMSASGKMFSSFSDDAQANAAIRAAFEFAAGWASFPDPAGMTAHFTAAALFGALAGKKPSGSKAKSKAGGAKLGTFGGKKTGGVSGANVKSNITVNVAGFALGSSAQIGKAIGDSVGEFDGSHSGRV